GFVASKEKMNLLQFNPNLGHITTFGGHPVSAAAALASLQVLTESNLIKEVDQKGKRFKKAIQNHLHVKEIRQIGLMLAVELKSQEIAAKLMPILLENKLIVDQFLFNSSSFRIGPPLTITFEEIDEIIKTVLKSLDQIENSN
ncbi:MAG: aminotransferase class III-fold pyridoxal phosphate-dependent enzyme, partial [Bacteroidales bacterium]|nr:aminotransferase class III-fold pyridoxal phosphate-dependent enzyme [Bacteroidales bacterium]